MRNSKLPEVGVTIFTVMSQLAQELGAINLSQGFPDYPCDPLLIERLAEAARAGFNQYAPMAGLPSLREAIAAKIGLHRGLAVNPETEITVTAGATQAIFTAIAMAVCAGDEVILLDPAYDSYAPAILTQGGVPVRLALTAPDFRVDWDALAAAVTPRTRMVVVNNPNNPAASVLSREDLACLSTLAERHDLLVLADEVYEHLVFDGREHCSVLAHPGLRARSLAVYSFGKTFHATGWKLGYCVAPPALTREFRKVHQFLVFCVNAPAQHALAAHLESPACWQALPDFFAVRRDRLAQGLQEAGFRLLPCAGTYFQLADYSAIRADLDEMAFARWLAVEYGVAAIPLMPFYADGRSQHLVRFCFAKEFSTLDAALARLAALSRGSWKNGPLRGH